MRSTQDQLEFADVLRVYHVDCNVSLNTDKTSYRYNGVYGYVTDSQEFTLSTFPNVDAWSVDDVKSALSHPRLSKRAVSLWFLQHNRYQLFTQLYSKLYSSITHHETYDSFLFPFYGRGGWVVYGDTRNNLERAMTRITNQRDDEAILRESMFRLGNYFEKNTRRRKYRLIHSIFTRLQTRLHKRLALLDHELVERVTHSSKPHPKRKLRLQELKKLIDNSETGLFMTNVKGKLKLYEKAKPGKQPRLIGDYTCPGSLLAGFLAEIAKEVFEDPLHLNGFTSQYVSTIEPEVLDEIAKRLLNDTKDQHYFFSDDAIFKINGKFYELDIKSCDISNDSPIFKILLFLFEGTQFYELIRRAVKQCETSLVLRDPENRHNSIRLSGTRPIEYSGSVLTTLLNNIASLIIGLSIHFNRASTREDVMAAARAVGYNVTLEERDCLEKLTFLKHSWSYDGSYEPRSFLNLGAILRSFGTYTGDLPGRNNRNISTRVNDFLGTVVSGYCHSGETRVLMALQKRFRFKTGYYDQFVDNKHFSKSRRGFIPDVSICKRYDCSTVEIDELCRLIIETPLFTHMHCTILDKIFAVDYGLGT
jgi:hypothetical protein